ncbi:MAG: hypothetical protein AB7G75_27110 [Candidatus Binatia bacterium]
MMRFVEQVPDPRQQLLGIAALLGMEVSVHEVARVANVFPHEVAIAFARAVKLGILIERHSGRVCFAHEQVWNAAFALLEPTARFAAHARAARLLVGTTPASVSRRAQHAFGAASRSTEDAIFAIQLAREAATALQAGDGFAQAAALLGQAVELHDAAALPGPAAILIVEWAEAVLACGHLAEARPLFHRAARLAEVEEDTNTLARAALGLGGVWVREHRFTEEAERVAALQQRVLDALPIEATVLRTRLRVRVAAERAYRGGSVSHVRQGVEMARQTGDAHALAEALSLCHHALLTPEHTKSRLIVANELISVASVAEDRLLSLIGLCWRAADLFLLGDPSAGAALTELRLRAEALRCHSILFIVRAMEVMLAIRAGQFSEAEEAAAACYQLGTEVGDADALPYYGAHVAAIRIFQGREVEIADLAASIATSPTLTERDRSFSCAAALFALRGGQPQQARALLEELRRSGLHSIVPTSAWLLTMLGVAELATALGDPQISQDVYNELFPYADLPIMASLAVVCFGSVHRPLALAALTCGKIDLAIEHFSTAVTMNERLGHRPAAIQTRAELALALLRRGKTSDIQRGKVLIQEAMTEAEALGMIGLIARWQEGLQETEKTTAPLAPEGICLSSAPQGGWRVVLGRHVATVSDLVGMRYLARLVAEPNRDIPALALVADSGEQLLPSHAHTVMDGTAVTAVRTRIRELRQRSELRAEEQEELETLTHELARACGLGGRIRSFADVPERARTAVRKALKRALEQITLANPVVGQYLAERIETGSVCCYRIGDSPRMSSTSTSSR